jgi:ABC-type multidrug transport system fused ATPase/permease subunit
MMIELEKFLLKLLIPIIFVLTVISSMILFYYLEWTDTKWSFMVCLLVILPSLIFVAAYILNGLQNSLQRLEKKEESSIRMTTEERLSILVEIQKILKESKVNL